MILWTEAVGYDIGTPADDRGIALHPIAIAIAIGSVASLGAFAAEKKQVDYALKMRAEFGLGTNRATVEGHMGTSADVATGAIGIPMTRGELDALDIDGRVRFSTSVQRKVAHVAGAAALSSIATLSTRRTTGT